ncbi:MAG: response regulator [Myxococcales bacterium]|nr:response regulator [Myxococcales bacterium]
MRRGSELWTGSVRAGLITLGICSLLSVAVVARQRAAAADRWRDHLESVANHYSDVARLWFDERRGDSAILSESLATTQALELSRTLGVGAVVEDALPRHLARYLAAYGYERIAVFDTELRPIARAGGEGGLDLTPVARRALASRAFVVDVEGTEVAQHHFLFAMPIPSPAGLAAEPHGVVVLVSNPHVALYPRLKQPTDSSSAETVLVRMSGSEVWFLSPLRDQPGHRLVVRPSRPSLAAAVATRGEARVGEFLDYRGARVLAATRPLNEPNWAVVSKVDVADVHSPARALGGWLVGASILAAALAAAFGALWSRRERERKLAADLAHSERELELGRLETMAHASQTRALELEQKMLEAQKMEAVGRLAGGIAHDFNKLLTVILSAADELRHASDRDEVNEIIESARKASDLTAQLLAFGRRQVLAPTSHDVNEIITSLQKLLVRVLREDIRVELVLAAEPLTVQVDRGQLERALINLAINARDAMPAGGVLRFTTRRREASAVIEVADTGTGMDDETRRRVFEPFFTTKPTGAGTGLGLAMVHGFVHQSQGSIAVESAPGAGSTFSIRLPVVDGRPHRSEPAQPRGPRRAERLLLVEDEPALRRSTSRALTRRGYQVVEAASAEEALACMDAEVSGVALVVTDVIMSGMNGIALATELRARRPELPVVFISGYAPEDLHDGLVSCASGFVMKPFTNDQLCVAIRDALDARPHELRAS